MRSDKKSRIEALYAEVLADPLYRSDGMGETFVPASGTPDAPVVLVGEAPGRDEERMGQPFVGAAGKNLDALLRHIELARDDVYITNLTKFRPRTPTGHNRKPTGKESRAALPYLIRELQIVGPAVIVCLGGAAACALLQQPNLKMQQANGKTWRHDGRPLLVTYHPSPFNFYNPARRAALFAAFEELRALVAENTVGHKK